MESVHVRLSLGAAALALVTASCATGVTTPPVDGLAATAVALPTATSTTDPVRPDPTFVLPDVTERPLTSADLAGMLPGGDATVVANTDLITRTVDDSDDAAADVLGFHREVGVASSMATGTGTAYVWIDLLADADSAHRYLIDTAGDIVKRTGGTHTPEVGATATAEFPITVGEESIGLQMELDGTIMHETAVLFRLGRIVVYTGLEHPAGVDLRVPLQYLAEDVQQRVIATLATTPVAGADPEQPAYRFETTITVEAESGTWLVERSGFIAGSDLACRVRSAGPDGERVVVVRQVAGSISFAEGDAPLAAAGAGDLAVRAVAAGCASWPLDVSAAGFESLMGATSTRHRINGVNASGYTPEPSALGPVLGSSLDGVEVESFTFWVAEDTRWIVEIGFIASGEAAVLAAALPPEWSRFGAIRMTVRHRVFDLGTTDPAVVTADFATAALP